LGSVGSVVFEELRKEKEKFATTLNVPKMLESPSQHQEDVCTKFEHFSEALRRP
jgi:hypothetical protein